MTEIKHHFDYIQWFKEKFIAGPAIPSMPVQAGDLHSGRLNFGSGIKGNQTLLAVKLNEQQRPDVIIMSEGSGRNGHTDTKLVYTYDVSSRLVEVRKRKVTHYPYMNSTDRQSCLCFSYPPQITDTPLEQVGQPEIDPREFNPFLRSVQDDRLALLDETIFFPGFYQSFDWSR